MPLSIGKAYTRKQIHQAVGGGDLQSYLPHAKGDVLCGCFDPRLNSRAPVEIDLGTGKDVVRYAKRLLAQGTAVPVFLKQATDEWEYKGRFRAVKYGTSARDLHQSKKRRANAIAVLYLVAVDETENEGMTDDPSVTVQIAAEGGRALVEHLRRERSRQLAEAKRRAYRSEHGQLNCEACRLSESDLPATIGEGCFEVHHLAPLAGRRTSSPTRIADLALLCANCHRLIHRSHPMLTVSGLRELREQTPND